MSIKDLRLQESRRRKYMRRKEKRNWVNLALESVLGRGYWLSKKQKRSIARKA